MGKHEQVPFTFTVKTRPEFCKAWRVANACIAALKVAKKIGEPEKRPGYAVEVEERQQAIHTLIVGEIEFHLEAHEYKLVQLRNYATMAYGALLVLDLLLPAEVWQE